MSELRDTHTVEPDDAKVARYTVLTNVETGDDSERDDVSRSHNGPSCVPIRKDEVDGLLTPVEVELAQIRGAFGEVLLEVLEPFMARRRSRSSSHVENWLHFRVYVCLYVSRDETHASVVVTAHEMDVRVYHLSVKLNGQSRLGSALNGGRALDLVAGDHHDGVDLPAQERLHPSSFDAEVAARAEDEDIGLGSLEGRRQVLCQGREEGVVEIRHE